MYVARSGINKSADQLNGVFHVLIIPMDITAVAISEDSDVSDYGLNT